MIAAGLLLLGACVSAPGNIADWNPYVGGIDALSDREFAAVLDEAKEKYLAGPNDEIRVRLGYLLSRPDRPAQDIGESRRVLAEIDPDSAYAPLRDLLQREVELLSELGSAGRETSNLSAQVAMLEADIAEQHTRLVALQSRIAELQTQLEALKSIETKITEDQKAIDELSQ
ncbi:MAG: hypothetical protein ACREQZ_08425 [Woeseiaceae bacterium]